MSIDRSIMILYPSRYRILITRRSILMRVYLVLVFVIIAMIPHHFYFYYNKSMTLFICDFHRFIDRWRIHLWPYIHAILFVLLPVIIVYISSIILLHNRCEHRRVAKNNLSENARRMERNSILIFFMTIAISLSLFPFVILEIFTVRDRLYNLELLCGKRWNTYLILRYWFLILGVFTYSFKFYLRLIISKTFRQQFLQLISCSAYRQVQMSERHFIPLKRK